MKKFLFLIVFFLGMSTGISLAANINSYTVDAENSTTLKSVFQFNEDPWLYVNIGGGGGHIPHVQTDWLFNSVVEGEDDEVGSAGQDDFWFSPANWATIKKPGLWTVNSFYQIEHKDNGNFLNDGSDIAAFTVTPEPATMALFGLGAGALGLKKFRRKKV